MRLPFASLLLLPCLALHASPHACHADSEAAAFEGKDVCITAHVYDVAVLRDGTRFLDTCRPDTPNEACRFTIASLPQDRRDVGELAALRGQDIQLRGVVHSVNQRSIIYLSNARQLHGGPEKFRPNPALMAGFSAQDSKTPIHDASLGGKHPSSTFRASR